MIRLKNLLRQNVSLPLLASLKQGKGSLAVPVTSPAAFSTSPKLSKHQTILPRVCTKSFITPEVWLGQQLPELLKAAALAAHLTSWPQPPSAWVRLGKQLLTPLPFLEKVWHSKEHSSSQDTVNRSSSLSRGNFMWHSLFSLPDQQNTSHTTLINALL